MLLDQLLQEVNGPFVSLLGIFICANLGEKSTVHLLSDQLTVSVKTMSIRFLKRKRIRAECVRNAQEMI